MKVSRESLASALDEVASAVKLRDGSPVLFRPGRLLATDMRVTLSLPIDSDLDCALPFVQLRTFVKSAAGDEVSLTVAGTKVKVKIGRATMNLALMDNDVALPRPGVVSGSVELTGTDLKRLVDMTSYATTQDRPQFSGALWFTEDGHLVSAATDTKRLAEMRVMVKGSIPRIVIPRHGMDAFSKVFATSPRVDIDQAGNLMILRAENKIMHVVLLEPDFPGYRHLLTMKGSEKVRIKRDALIAALRAISAAVGLLPRVELNIWPGGMKVSAVKEDIGDGADEIEVEYEGFGVVVCLNYYFLLEMLYRLPSPELYLWADSRIGKPVIVEPAGENNLKVMIAPMTV